MKWFSILTIILFSSSLFAQDSLEDLEKMLPLKQGLEKIHILNRLIDLSKEDSPEKTLEYAETALAIFEASKTENGKAEVLYEAGEASRKLGNYEKAIEFLQKIADVSNTPPPLLSKTYRSMAGAYRSMNDYQSAIQAYESALIIELDSGNESRSASILNSMGITYSRMANYDKSLESHRRALQIREALGDQKNIAGSLNNIGLIYRNISDHDEALKHYFQALQIKEELGDKSSIAATANNIGIVYRNIGEFDKALEFYSKSLSLREELGLTKTRSFASTLNNMGVTYWSMKNNDKALEFYDRALQIDREIDNKRGEALRLNNIGIIYREQEKYTEALANFQKSLQLKEQFKDRRGIAATLNNIGSTNARMNNYDEALQAIESSLEISQSIKARDITQNNYGALINLYESRKDFENAFRYAKLHAALNDSLYSDESSRVMAEVRTQFEVARQQKEIEALTEKEALQLLVIKILSVGLGSFIIMGIIIYQLHKIKNKSNKLIKSVINSLTHPFYVINARDHSVELANSVVSAGFKERIKKYKANSDQNGGDKEYEFPTTVNEVKETKLPFTKEYTYGDEGSELSSYEIHGFPVYDKNGNVEKVIEYSLDINERKRNEEEKKRLEEQLFQAQKMESIGRLAGGIAHDFNNILASIMGFAEILDEELVDTNPRVKNAAQVIIKATKRGAGLSRQLLGFARKGMYNPVPVNINEVVQNTLKISEKIFKQNITIQLNFENNIHNIFADEHQMEQVFTNLIINAREAMPKGGTLSLKTENFYADDTFSKYYPELPAGEYVRTSVSDTGSGMSHKTMKQIFEPFFTTKESGTGLGLATVFGIVENHKGKIYCDSVEGEGTTFTVYFPATRASAIDKKSDVDAVEGKSGILLVDDESDLRNMIYSYMGGLGYNILCAKDGKEGIATYKKYKDDIDIVLLDIIMPEMNGAEVFKELKIINPDVKVLLLSGFSQDDIAKEVLDSGAQGFLQKPFSLRELTQRVNKLL